MLVCVQVAYVHVLERFYMKELPAASENDTNSSGESEPQKQSRQP